MSYKGVISLIILLLPIKVVVNKIKNTHPSYTILNPKLNIAYTIKKECTLDKYCSLRDSAFILSFLSLLLTTSFFTKTYLFISIATLTLTYLVYSCKNYSIADIKNMINRNFIIEGYKGYKDTLDKLKHIYKENMFTDLATNIYIFLYSFIIGTLLHVPVQNLVMLTPSLVYDVNYNLRDLNSKASNYTKLLMSN